MRWREKEFKTTGDRFFLDRDILFITGVASCNYNLFIFTISLTLPQLVKLPRIRFSHHVQLLLYNLPLKPTKFLPINKSHKQSFQPQQPQKQSTPNSPHSLSSSSLQTARFRQRMMPGIHITRLFSNRRGRRRRRV
jgi:hypothetical protein